MEIVKDIFMGQVFVFFIILEVILLGMLISQIKAIVKNRRMNRDVRGLTEYSMDMGIQDGLNLYYADAAYRKRISKDPNVEIKG